MHCHQWVIFLALVSHITSNPTFLTSDSVVREESLVSDLTFDGQPDDEHLLQFSSFGRKYSLRLTPANSIFAPNFRIKRSPNSTIVDTIIGTGRGNLYTEKDGLGSYYVEIVNGQIRLDGIVDDQVRISNEDGVHRAFRVSNKHSKQAFENDALIYHPLNREEECRETEAPEIPTSPPEQPTAIPPLPDTVTVEVYTAIDNVLHTALQKKKLPVQKYLGVMWNFVQNKYKTTSQPRIEFAITGCIILPESEWVTETIVRDNVVNSHQLLFNFGKWLYSQLNEVSNPQYDIAILHTGLDLASPTNVPDQVSTLNLGVAYLQGVCKIVEEVELVMSAGAMEDLDPSLNFEDIVVVAHEVAHLFGASHDNEQPKSQNCPLNYMMYYAVGPATIEKFSNCSLKLMREHLNKDESACIRNPPVPTDIPLLTPEEPNEPEPTEPEPEPETEPPTELTPDRVCKKLYGEKSKWFPKPSIDPCWLLFCEKNEIEVEAQSGRTPNGMKCDAHKVCMNNKCVDEKV